MTIEVRNLHKKFGQFTALNDVSLDFASGELIALLGPSGCGKTTLLRIIAGLENADSGSVLFHGEDATNLDIQKRNVGFVFQHYALFRHMTVFDNIAFGLRVRPKATRPSAVAIAQRVHELLNLVQLDWLADRFPHQLSGGQRQRIALARALAVEPKVLLLDEPFGALDAKVRKDLRRWLRRLHDDLHITSIFVTHDQEEAMEVADRIIVLNKGNIEQIGTPEEIYNRPATPFVYDFIGHANVFHGSAEADAIHIGDYSLHNTGEQFEPCPSVAVYVRPHNFALSSEPKDGYFEAKIAYINAASAVIRLELRSAISEQQIQVEVPRSMANLLQLEPGSVIYAKPTEFRWFSK